MPSGTTAFIRAGIAHRPDCYPDYEENVPTISEFVRNFLAENHLRMTSLEYGRAVIPDSLGAKVLCLRGELWSKNV
jgi:hypothetical protein